MSYMSRANPSRKEVEMQYGDFSSLVQLGVGLHVGTAVLQIFGELGLQPITRTMTRLHALMSNEEDTSTVSNQQLEKLEGDLEIFKIQYFQQFKKYIFFSSVVAALLAILLVIIAYKDRDEIAAEFSVFVSAFSILPAPIILAVFWKDCSSALKPIMDRATRLETEKLR
jgi:hypothetical protein